MQAASNPDVNLGVRKSASSKYMPRRSFLQHLRLSSLHLSFLLFVNHARCSAHSTRSTRSASAIARTESLRPCVPTSLRNSLSDRPARLAARLEIAH